MAGSGTATRMIREVTLVDANYIYRRWDDYLTHVFRARQDTLRFDWAAVRGAKGRTTIYTRAPQAKSGNESEDEEFSEDNLARIGKIPRMQIVTGDVVKGRSRGVDAKIVKGLIDTGNNRHTKKVTLISSDPDFGAVLGEVRNTGTEIAVVVENNDATTELRKHADETRLIDWRTILSWTMGTETANLGAAPVEQPQDQIRWSPTRTNMRIGTSRVRDLFGVCIESVDASCATPRQEKTVKMLCSKDRTLLRRVVERDSNTRFVGRRRGI